MYGMTNSGKLFADELTEWLLEAGFIPYINVICLSIISMHQMDNFLSYLMLMTVSIGILLRLLENDLWII